MPIGISSSLLVVSKKFASGTGLVAIMIVFLLAGRSLTGFCFS